MSARRAAGKADSGRGVDPAPTPKATVRAIGGRYSNMRLQPVEGEGASSIAKVDLDSDLLSDRPSLATAGSRAWR